MLLFVSTSLLPHGISRVEAGQSDMDGVRTLAVTVREAHSFLCLALVWWTDIFIRLGIDTNSTLVWGSWVPLGGVEVVSTVIVALIFPRPVL